MGLLRRVARTVSRMCLGGCGTLVRQGRCFSCRQQTERMRGSPSSRGYGTNHRRAREALAASLPAPCMYGDGLIYPGERWVAAHVRDGQPEYGYGPAHPACNERAKSRYRAVRQPGLRL